MIRTEEGYKTIKVKVKELENRERNHVKLYNYIKLNNTYLICLIDLMNQEKEKSKIRNLEEEEKEQKQDEN